MDVATLSGKIAANRAAANVLSSLRWSSDAQFAYYSNKYASEKNKDEFTKEIDALVSRLYKREQKLLEQLMGPPLPTK